MRRLCLLLAVLSAATTAFAQCTITSDANPPLVSAGGQHSFTQSGCGSGVWSATGGLGSINATTGVYSAPVTYPALAHDRGCQLSPQNAAWNVPIDTLPIHSQSATWMNRVYQAGLYQDGGGNPFHYGERFFLNYDNFHTTPIDNATSVDQNIHCFYNCGGNEGTYKLPSSQVNMRRQHGWHFDPASTSGTPFAQDFHVFTVNKDSCANQEPYQLTLDGGTATTVVSDGGANTLVTYTSTTHWPLYTPVRMFVQDAGGAWTGFNNTSTGYRAVVVAQNLTTGVITLKFAFDSRSLGAAPSGIKLGPWLGSTSGFGGTDATVNAEGASKWSPGTNAIPAGNGSDAPGSNMDATSFNMQEWNDALLKCVSTPCTNDMGHAIGTTLANNMISARDLWPSINGTGVTSGHNLLAITVVSATNPATLTTSSNFSVFSPCTDLSQRNNYAVGYSPGCQFPVHIDITGNCSAVAGDWTATAIDATHATIPVMGCGAFTGTVTLINNWMPYGARFRMQAGYDPTPICTFSSFAPASDQCKLVQVLINTYKKYGAMMLDGTLVSDDWDMRNIADEYMTDAERDVIYWMNYYFQSRTSTSELFDRWLDIVDPSGIQITTDNTSTSWMGSTERRETVTFTGGSGTASLDVLIQGTAVGTYWERVSMAAGTAYTLPYWVTGNTNTTATCSASPSISGVTVATNCAISVSSGISSANIQTTTVAITSVADPSAKAYVQLDVIPVSPDGRIRLTFGQTNYLASDGNLWYGTPVARGYTQYFSDPVVGTIQIFGSWMYHPAQWAAWGNPDTPLYNHGIMGAYDIVGRLILPNGTWNISFLGEPGCNSYNCDNLPNFDIFDVEVQGATVASDLDGYQLANGAYKGYTITYPMTVADGTAEFAYRGRVASAYGVSLSSVMLSPGSPQAAAPTFAPPGGNYGLPQTVSISTISPGATIRYTTDGTTPTETHGVVYSGPVTVSVTKTLKAIAYGAGYTDSPVASASYIIGLTAPHLKIGPCGTACVGIGAATGLN